jgi:death on curing protein
MAARRWSTSVPTELWYPILADVLALHAAAMRGLGESPAPLVAGGRDKLDSAIAAPRWAAQHSHSDLADQAALLTVRIAQAHALVDNNKRLAYIVAVVFLRENGHPLPAEHAMSFARHIGSALEHTQTVTAFGTWLREVIGLDQSRGPDED